MRSPKKVVFETLPKWGGGETQQITVLMIRKDGSSVPIFQEVADDLSPHVERARFLFPEAFENEIGAEPRDRLDPETLVKENEMNARRDQPGVNIGERA